MRINHNIAALNTYRQLNSAANAQSKSMERLSSGLRINKAGDDAAGLAISEKMRGQIRGLEMASKNAQDGVSLIQTAEGALNETHSILQRMRELSVQAANGTSTDEDRAEIQKEISQLVQEVDRISSATEFNTKKLLNGDVSIKANSATNFASTGIDAVKVIDDTIKDDTYSVITTAVTDVVSLGTNSTDITAVAITNDNVEYGSYKVVVADNSTDSTKSDYTLFDKDGNELAKVTAADSATSVAVGDFTLTDAATSVPGELNFTVGATTTFEVQDSGGNTVETVSLTNDTTGKVQVGGFEFSIDSSLAAAGGTDSDLVVNDDSVEFQIGANEGQTSKLAIADMSATALGINNVNLSTKEGAQAAITTINDAIQTVSSERSKMGAVQNRLEHTINNLGTSAENLTAAESRIRDVDMAKEMMNQTKNSILAQAAQAMLAQSNQMPQGVLQLLR